MNVRISTDIKSEGAESYYEDITHIKIDYVLDNRVIRQRFGISDKHGYTCFLTEDFYSKLQIKILKL